MRARTFTSGSFAPVCRQPHSFPATTKACYHYFSLVLLLLTAGLSNSLVSSLTESVTSATSITTTRLSTTAIANGSSSTTTTLGPDTAVVQTGPLSSTGEHASLDESHVGASSSGGSGQQQQPKSLEFLLRNSSGKDNELVDEVNTQTSHNGIEFSQRANTPAITTTTTTTLVTTIKPPSVSTQIIPQPQTKSLKFTLIAGKAWKFNLKGNSLSTHKGTELRLHRNISTDNYIIDDESWFQYNPQLQQLFAWPTLATKSGTYYFVLLPSGIDFEADSENVVNLEVAASIVVELIKPVYQGSGKTGDIDQLIDYKFSLDYLHRRATYPLLLNQIFSVFETLAKSNPSNHTNHVTTSPPSLITTIAPSQQVVSRPSNKLGEIILLNSSYTSDGELFSVTWSMHPGLLNNTITPISECRVTAINDTVSKLSNLSAGYQSEDEKFTILYTLEVQQSNSQAIVPTERSNALKLILNGPCQTAKIIEELGVQQQVGKVAGAILNADDNENNVADQSGTSAAAVFKTTANPTTNSPNLPGSEATVTNSTANQFTANEASPSPPSSSLQKQDKEEFTTFSTITVRSSSNSSDPTPQVVFDSQPRSISHQSDSTSPEPPVLISSPPPSPTPSIKTESPIIKATSSNTLHQQPKVQPQAKSLEDFLEMTDMQSTSTPASSTPEMATTSQSNLSSVNVVESTTIAGSVNLVPTRTVTPVPAESTLNEDFMGILDEVMNYLISVAVPASIIVGAILLVSIIFASCHLYRKRKKSKEFQVRNRFDFRYSSERKGFLKNSSRPVILEADQKSLSMGGTPQHKASTKAKQKITDEERKHYLPMSTMYYETSNAEPVTAGGSRTANVTPKHE